MPKINKHCIVYIICDVQGEQCDIFDEYELIYSYET